MLTYDRIKDSFVRALESAGLVSLDSGRHKQLSELVDLHTEAVRRFVTEEQPEEIAQAPKADPAASANDAAEWLKDIALPEGWAFRQIPTTAHGAGRSVFAHYDVATQTPVAGVAHVHLISPDKQIVDIKFRASEGIEGLREQVEFAISEYGKVPEVLSPIIFTGGAFRPENLDGGDFGIGTQESEPVEPDPTPTSDTSTSTTEAGSSPEPTTESAELACPNCGRTDQHHESECVLPLPTAEEESDASGQ